MSSDLGNIYERLDFRRDFGFFVDEGQSRMRGWEVLLFFLRYQYQYLGDTQTQITYGDFFKRRVSPQNRLTNHKPDQKL